MKCIDNYYLNGTNCYNNCSYYYFFDDLHKLHCTEDKNCPKNKSKLIIEKGECIDDCSKDNLYKYEYNNCGFKSCLDIPDILGLTRKYKIYYDYYKTKCIDNIPDGYYLNDTNNKTIDKCNVKCKTCDSESNSNDLCLSCNILNGYYPILNDNSNTNSFFNCLNYTPSGYLFDNYTLSYKPCYSSCKECTKIGDNYNHQCLQCIDNYYLKDTNCYENCSYYYYFDDLHTHYCTENKKCPEDKSKLIIEKGECVNNCSKDYLYKYEYNNSCFKSCLDIPKILGLTEENNIYYDYYKTKCIDNMPDGYYLMDTNIILLI